MTLDRIFCAAAPRCLTLDCDRRVTDVVRDAAERARKWMSYADLSAECERYQPELAP